MGTAAAFLVIAVMGALGIRWQKTPRPGYGPFPMAFSYTLLGVVSLIGGVLGFMFQRTDELIGGKLTGAVVWPEVGFGFAMLVISIYFWRKALQTI